MLSLEISPETLSSEVAPSRFQTSKLGESLVPLPSNHKISSSSTEVPPIAEVQSPNTIKVLMQVLSCP